MPVATKHTFTLSGVLSSGVLTAITSASVLIRRAGATATVYSSAARAPLANPLPTGVAAGAPGLDGDGDVVVWLDAASDYDASVTVNGVTTTVALPTIPTDPADVASGVPDGSVTDVKVAANAGIAQSKVANLVTDLSNKQPLDSDLTAIAALNTTGFGRALLELADAQATRIAIGVNRWPERYPANSGQDYNGNSVEGGNTVSTSASSVGTLIAGGPLWSGPGFTINLLDAYMNAAGSAGAVYRMGVWLIDSLADPFTWATGTQYATLLLDAGTVDATTVGRKTLTVSAVIPAGRWFVVGGAQQVAGSAPVVAASQNGFCPSGQGNVASGVFSTRRWPVMTGITGALSNLTPNSASSTGHGVGFRRA